MTEGTTGGQNLPQERRVGRWVTQTGLPISGWS
jgi:hypothetical protein